VSGNRLLELAGRYADGAASGEEVRALEEALRRDPAFRREFVRYLNLDAALGGQVTACRPVGGAAGGGDLRRWRAATLAAAAALVLVGMVLWRPWSRSLGPGAPPVTLVAATDARWADADTELLLRSGEAPDGLLRLESGLAEFRFAGGATALLQGPAVGRFPGPNRMFLQEGKVLCRCPTPASRITLTTPATQVVDLGTEFAVEVVPGQTGTRVAVVSGKVEVGAAPARVLGTGEAAQVGPDQVVHLAPLPPDAFADLLKAGVSATAPSGWGDSLLADPAFAADAAHSPWYRTEGYAEPTGCAGAIAVHARGHRFWPGVRQRVTTGDIAGRAVVGSVEAMMPANDPLQERQWAILKLAFVDAQGREFASAFRYFLRAADQPGQYVAAQVATRAPAGTRRVEVQLLLNARGLAKGTVWFRNAKLVVAISGESSQPTGTASSPTSSTGKE
jgi:hypothetical protein